MSTRLPLEYVFAGAHVVYHASLKSVRGYPIGNAFYPGYFQGAVARFRVSMPHVQFGATEVNERSGSAFFNFTSLIDRRSINDIKADADNAFKAAGADVVSMIRFISNPRRDGQQQPPVSAPGVPPPVGKLPPAAGNVNTGRGGLELFPGFNLPSLPGGSMTWLLIGGAILFVSFRR